MKIKYFDTFEEASNFARDHAISHGLTVQCGRKGSRFFAEMPQEAKPSNNKRTNRKIFPDKTLDYEEADDGIEIGVGKTYDAEILDEKMDYSDSIARSNEDGWFYDKTDGDWENNLVDPDSE